MTIGPASPNSSSSALSAVDAFFQSLEARTSDPAHLRLISAAKKADPTPALEKELRKIIEELLNEA